MKIGKNLGIGTGTVQGVLMEQPRPFDIDVVAEAYTYLSVTQKWPPVRVSSAR